MQDAKIERALKKVLGTRRNWLRRMSQHLLDRESEDIEKDLSSGNGAKSLIGVATSLNTLGEVYGAKAVVELWTHDSPFSFDDLRKSIGYQYWAAVIKSELFLGQSRLGFQVLDLTNHFANLANLVCATTAFRASSMNHYLVSLMNRLIDNGGFNTDYWNEATFEPFVHWLHGGDLRDSFGCYQPIVGAWPMVCPNDLSAICDFHVRRSDEYKEDMWNLEFVDAPFDLIPFEVFAIAHKLEENHASLPSFEHPLYPEFVADLIDQPCMEYRDEIVERVEDRVCQFLL